MLFSHFILSIFFSLSNCGHCLEFAGWSPEQLTHLACLSHTPDGSQCSGLPQLQHVYHIYFGGDQTLDICYTEVGLVYRHLLFACIKPILTSVGKLGELNVRTNVLVGFIIPSWRTVILRTSITPCSAMPSLISSFVTLLKAGQQTIPFDVFRDECGVTEHFRPKMSCTLTYFSYVVDLFHATL